MILVNRGAEVEKSRIQIHDNFYISRLNLYHGTPKCRSEIGDVTIKKAEI